MDEAAQCDRIIVMEGGRISQIGTHEELLETSDIYRETYTSQNKMSKEAQEVEEATAEAVAEMAQDAPAADQTQVDKATTPQDIDQKGGEANE